MKNKLKEKVKQKLKCFKPTHFFLTSISEFVMSSVDSVFSKSFTTGGTLKSLLIKNCVKVVSEEFQDYPVNNGNSLQYHKKY